MRRVEMSSLHKGVSGSEHSFMPLPPGANKLTLLNQARIAPCAFSSCLFPR